MPTLGLCLPLQGGFLTARCPSPELAVEDADNPSAPAIDMTSLPTPSFARDMSDF